MATKKAGSGTGTGPKRPVVARKVDPAAATATATASQVTVPPAKSGARGTMTPTSEQDHLRVDPERRGQKFAVLSVINPEAILADRAAFDFARFMRSIGADIGAMLDTIVEQGNSKVGFADPAASVRMIRERYAYLWNDASMQDELRFFRRAHEARLTGDFDREHDFATSIRGIKIRGVCESQHEAHALIDELKAIDTTHSMFIGNVGYWLPLDVHPDDVKDNEYSETQLNTLMKKYTESQAENDVRYTMRTNELKARVMSDNTDKRAAAAEAAVAVVVADAAAVEDAYTIREGGDEGEKGEAGEKAEEGEEGEKEEEVLPSKQLGEMESQDAWMAMKIRNETSSSTV